MFVEEQGTDNGTRALWHQTGALRPHWENKTSEGSSVPFLPRGQVTANTRGFEAVDGFRGKPMAVGCGAVFQL